VEYQSVTPRVAGRLAGAVARWVVLATVCAALAGCHDEHWLTYPWDDRRVLCSQPVDDISDTPPWDLVEDQMQLAEQTKAVLLLHAHTPGASITTAAIERVLTMAGDHHLAFLTFRELVPGAAPRAGLALAFDDNGIDAWFSIRDLLAAHGAHVTFFVTRWYSRTDAERAELWTLFGDGHDVEPHTVNHLHALQYVRDHGIDAYLADEVIPSIDGLTQAGYPPPDTFAYPFGEHTDELDAAVLEIVPRVRVSPGSCPY
jgi:Polysaccharide deacetylase